VAGVRQADRFRPDAPIGGARRAARGGGRAARLTFRDPDQYAEALRVAAATLVITEPGDFQASLVRAELESVWLQRGHVSVGRIGRARVIARSHFIFLAEEGVPQRWFGRDLGAADLFSLGGAEELAMSAAHGGTWGTLSFAPEDLRRLSAALLGRDLQVGEAGVVAQVRPPPAALARIRRLHRQLARLSRDRTDLIGVPAIAQRWDDALVRTLLDAVDVGEVVRERNTWRRHTQIVRRIEDALAAQPDQPLTLTELCLATRVTERTLHASCKEQYGVSPLQYLRLRRMNQARQALLRADPQSDTVTDVAARHGFWELGRFAQRYRALFGESPRQTLRRR